MKIFLFVLLPALVASPATTVAAVDWLGISEKGFDVGHHSQCVLKNLKPGMGDSAAKQISAACEIQARPKICRGLDAVKTNECIKTCSGESLWSRNFGDCSLD
jgi:hypothetical protein